MDIDLEEQVRYRAYEIWECEGRPNGREGLHWEQAVGEIISLSRAQAPAKSKAPVKKAVKPISVKQSSAKRPRASAHIN